MLSVHVLDATGSYLGYLHSATRIAFLAELNNPGSGSFEINPDAADASLIVSERIIEVRWLESAIGHWVIQSIEEPLVTTSRSEMIRVSGQGLMGLLRGANLYPHAWPLLTNQESLSIPLVCAPTVGAGFLAMFNGNVELPFWINFGATTDTDLATWPDDIHLEFRYGQNMLDVVTALSGFGHDFVMSGDRSLDAYVVAGSNLAATIVFIEGKNILAMKRTTDSLDLATVVLGSGQNAVVESTDFTWSTRRRQAHLAARGATDEQQVRAANELFLTRVRQPIQSYELTVRNSPVALYDYGLGDTIRVITKRGGQMTLRVLSIHIEETDTKSQVVTLGVNDTALGYTQRLATAINANSSVQAAAAWRLVTPDVRPARTLVTFDWLVSGTVSTGDQKGGVYEVTERLQVLGLTGGVGTAPGTSDASLSIQYSLDRMSTWNDLYSTDPIIGVGTKNISDGVLAMTLLQPGMWLRFKVDAVGSGPAMANLSARLRTMGV